MDISITEFKAKCVGIIGLVQREKRHIVIRRHGQPAAELIPPSRGTGDHVVFGRAKKTTRILGEVESTGESWNATH